MEEEKAELEARLAHKEEQLREVSAARDRALRALEARGDQPPPAEPRIAPSDEAAAAEPKSRLARCETHGERIEEQLTEAGAALSAARDARAAADDRAAALQRELDFVETCLTTTDRAGALPHLEMAVLYVGGRTAQIGRLREVTESTGALFLYHDAASRNAAGCCRAS